MGEQNVARVVSRHFTVSPDSILGLMMFGVVLALQEDQFSPVVLALVSLVGVFALWIAHVFAHTLAGYQVTKDHTVTLWHSFRQSVAAAWGMFAWSAPSAVVLFIAPVFGWSSSVATDISLSVMMGALFVFGYLVFTLRGRNVAVRLLGALATSVAGLLVIGVELLVRQLH